jgi:hypothetical protein
MGLRLSIDKSGTCHIDEGFDFLGFRIQRRAWHGRPGKRAVYTYPSKRSLAAVMGKVRTLTRRARHRTLADLLHAIEVLGRDVGLRQPAGHQQLAQMPCVTAVGLGPPLVALQCARFGRLGQMRLGADRVELFDHEAPPGRGLQRDLELLTGKPR